MKPSIRPCRWAALLGADALVVVQLRPSLQTLHSLATHPARSIQLHGPNATAALFADMLLWAVACWIGFGAICSGLGMIPGSFGRRVTEVAAAILPRALQRLIVTTASLSLLATVGATPATAAPATAGPVTAAPASRPAVTAAPATAAPASRPAVTAGPVTAAPASRPAVSAAAPAGIPSVPGEVPAARATFSTPGWPRDRPEPTTPTWPNGIVSKPELTRPATVTPPSCAEPISVDPGDSLWLITARRLASRGSGADAEQVARVWPAWWHRNHAAIGDDPGLLHPGTTLCSPQEGIS